MKYDKRPNLITSHLGYMCDAKKIVIVPKNVGCTMYEIQNMALHKKDAVGSAFEEWQAVFRGTLEPCKSPMGNYLIGNFSELSHPGIYRIVLPEDRGHSYQFPISDAVASMLPWMNLDFLHCQRCGPFENEWRGPCHLDDGLRSDTGRPIDATGGWHDGGDTRKDLCFATLPALGFMDIYERLGWHRNHWHENPWQDDLLAEIAWGVNFILKMQDSATGMIYENVGVGGTSRGISAEKWWYENLCGCYAGNEENRFTDNIPASGDERRVRVDYNPIVQYTNLYILARAASIFATVNPELADRCCTAALPCWQFTATCTGDQYHDWTSVRAWRLICATYLYRQSLIGEDEVKENFHRLIELQNSDRGFWYMDAGKTEPYRGIIQSAQPVIALGNLINLCPEHPLAAPATDVLRQCWTGFIKPMLATNPFGMMPYSLYFKPMSQGDRYHKLDKSSCFRFFMPANSPRKINHGISGHWMSWAHALALGGYVLDDNNWRQAAWNQIHWQLGFNPINTSYLTGVGYRNPMPHSRFLGTRAGGFCIGPRGDAQDRISTDHEGRAEWNSCEYTLMGSSNMLMALAYLLPRSVPNEKKLGIPPQFPLP